MGSWEYVESDQLWVRHPSLQIMLWGSSLTWNGLQLLLQVFHDLLHHRQNRGYTGQDVRDLGQAPRPSAISSHLISSHLSSPPLSSLPFSSLPSPFLFSQLIHEPGAMPPGCNPGSLSVIVASAIPPIPCALYTMLPDTPAIKEWDLCPHSLNSLKYRTW